MQLTTIFFDLDHTLWDFETNSRETLHEIIENFGLVELGIGNPDAFISTYQRINDALWEEYRKGRIERETLRNARFQIALKEFGIDNAELAHQIGDFYIRESPLKKNLFPNAIETLTYLSEKYKLHIITNGFNEVQFIKLRESGLSKFFSEVITSEAASSKKPESKIFEYALKLSKSNVEECIMVGDSLEHDIVGARNFGMKQIYFNPKAIAHQEMVSHEITSLEELMMLL